MDENTYAFDECSILHFCEMEIPAAYQIFFEEQTLTPRNHNAIKTTIQKLKNNGIMPCRFVPSENLDQNIIKVANQIIMDRGIEISSLGSTFKAQLVGQLEEFGDKIRENFEEIKKHDEIEHIKQIFIDNEKDLTKSRNIPEDDDLRVIAGYMKHPCEGNKYLISEDEHFWGYKDLILGKFNIRVVEEWKCHQVI